MILFLFLVFPFLGYSQTDFGQWVVQEMENIKKGETDSKILEIKQRPLIRSQEFLEKLGFSENTILVEPIGDFIYSEIVEKFQGKHKTAAELYWDITLGKKKPNLFIESGAGRSEKISDIRETSLGTEFTTDRKYKSALAFNTRTITRLRRFDISNKNSVIVVNELVKDLGQGVKPYGPVYFDLIVDAYQKIDDHHFIYRSWSSYKGQGMKSSSTSLNVAKSVGNIFSLGALDKGLGLKIQSEAKNIWTKRKELFQSIILKHVN